VSYLDQLFGLTGRVAVVTGGSSGIGRGIALALGQAGASVVIIARDQGNLDASVGELTAAGCAAASVSADLGDRAAVASAGPQAAEPFGSPDILVNCAGLNLRPPLGELTIEAWDELIAVNLTAAFLLGQLYGPPSAAGAASSMSPRSRPTAPSATAAATGRPRAASRR
jgi:NAD(P)-dependent dehydrogenase (short-subunit alcohol dehydrogenase family)